MGGTSYSYNPPGPGARITPEPPDAASRKRLDGLIAEVMLPSPDRTLALIRANFIAELRNAVELGYMSPSKAQDELKGFNDMQVLSPSLEPANPPGVEADERDKLLRMLREGIETGRLTVSEARDALAKFDRRAEALKFTMKTRWYTFGQAHRHDFMGTVIDRDMVLRVTAEDPAYEIGRRFGTRWSMEYDHQPDLRYFPRGCFELDELIRMGDIDHVERKMEV